MVATRGDDVTTERGDEFHTLTPAPTFLEAVPRLCPCAPNLLTITTCNLPQQRCTVRPSSKRRTRCGMVPRLPRLDAMT